MKIKKYEAKTESEAIEKVKEELGPSALILSIKTTQPKGLFSAFRSSSVEVTAAYDENNFKLPVEIVPSLPSLTPDNKLKEEIIKKSDQEFLNNKKLIEQNEKIRKLENKLLSTEDKLTNTEDMLEKTVSQLTIEKHKKISSSDRKYGNNVIQLFYDSLVNQGVTVEIAEEILSDAEDIDAYHEIDINIVVKIVYNKLISILGNPEIINLEGAKKYNPKIIVFMGPTGVGKTTTIAKLTSLFVLNSSKSVGLITADTYRIAAVEQLKTYAEILGIDVGVAYNKEDLQENINLLKKQKDIIIIDTAGRSHKNKETLIELKEYLACSPNADKFLVLSTTTKNDDLLNIVKTYSSITDFRLIFTKLDETTCLGSILNICHSTGKGLSYISVGQNVPDDIDVAQPEKIAKALMGLGGITD